MITGYISHDEAMIKHFAENPEYADELLNSVLTDGSEYEIQRVREWYNEAKSRSYWNALIQNAEHTAKNGKNIQDVIQMVKEALNILNAAVPASA